MTASLRIGNHGVEALVVTGMGQILDVQSHCLSLVLPSIATPAMSPTESQHQVSFNVLAAADSHSFIFTL